MLAFTSKAEAAIRPGQPLIAMKFWIFIQKFESHPEGTSGFSSVGAASSQSQNEVTQLSGGRYFTHLKGQLSF